MVLVDSLLRHNPLILVLQYMAIPKNKKAVRIKHILVLTADEFVIILNILAKQCFLFENIDVILSDNIFD